MASSGNASPKASLSDPLFPKVYLHSSPRETLLPHLLPLLPYTIPIARRIQFHLQTPYAQVLSTLPPSSKPQDHQTGTSQNPSLSTSEAAIPPFSTSYDEPQGNTLFNAAPKGQNSLTIPPDPPSQNASQSTNPSLSTNETSIPPLSTNYAEPPQDEPSDTAADFSPTVLRPSRHFAAAYIDRSRCPETEAWFFSTLELPSTSAPAEPMNDKIRLQAPALLMHHLSTLTPRAQEDIIRVSGIEPSHNLTNILCGATHRSTLEILHSGPVRNEDAKHALAGANVRESVDRKVVRGHTAANTKFLISPDGLGKGDTELPPGLEWTGTGQGRDLDEDDIKLALSLTAIPRRVQTMLLLPRLGIWTTKASSASSSDGGEDVNGNPVVVEQGTLVAWAFLGPDASLTTLHVQPSHRRRGLAQKLTRKLFAQVRDFPNPMLGKATAGTELKLQQQKAYAGIGEGQEWNHADVLWDNEASAGTMRAVGARACWDDFWAVVDLGRLEERVGREGRS